MSSVWVTVPSKRPPEHLAKWAAAWRGQGYSIAVWRDSPLGIDLSIADWWDGCIPYPGYSVATNRLIQHVIKDRGAQWCIIGGDDVYPDPDHTADEIAAQCEAHFGGTFGVLQCTGDRWGDDERSRDQYGADRGAYIDRIAGSAWIGREFAQRVYQGRGPIWPEFWHMFGDEHLQCVAEKLGVFWQRRDLTQRHEHWARGDGRTRDDMPEFLSKANSPEHWQESKAIFERLKAGGFAEAADLLTVPSVLPSGAEHWDKFKILFEERKAAGFPGHEPK